MSKYKLTMTKQMMFRSQFYFAGRKFQVNILETAQGFTNNCYQVLTQLALVALLEPIPVKHFELN